MGPVFINQETSPKPKSVLPRHMRKQIFSGLSDQDRGAEGAAGSSGPMGLSRVADGARQGSGGVRHAAAMTVIAKLTLNGE